MEYVNFNLVLLAMMVALLIWLMLPRRPLSADQSRPNSDSSYRREQKKVGQSQATQVAHAQGSAHQYPKSGRDLSKVPTPWGWPQHQKHAIHDSRPATASGHAHSMSESLHHWADVLIREKHTVDDEEYQHKKEVSMRTLMEDRYGRSSLKAQPGRADRSGAAVRSRSPLKKTSAAPSRIINSQVLRKSQTGKIALYKRQKMVEMQGGLKHLKMPWGW